MRARRIKLNPSESPFQFSIYVVCIIGLFVVGLIVTRPRMDVEQISVVDPKGVLSSEAQSRLIAEISSAVGASPSWDYRIVLDSLGDPAEPSPDPASVAIHLLDRKVDARWSDFMSQAAENGRPTVFLLAFPDVNFSTIRLFPEDGVFHFLKPLSARESGPIVAQPQSEGRHGVEQEASIRENLVELARRTKPSLVRPAGVPKFLRPETDGAFVVLLVLWVLSLLGVVAFLRSHFSGETRSGFGVAFAAHSQVTYFTLEYVFDVWFGSLWEDLILAYVSVFFLGLCLFAGARKLGSHPGRQASIAIACFALFGLVDSWERDHSFVRLEALLICLVLSLALATADEILGRGAENNDPIRS